VVPDVYGALLADVSAGRTATEVVERDDGFVLAFDSRYLVEPFTKWGDPNERRAMRSVRGRVLDVGCGGGRVALHLQEQGLDVVGIDSSRGAIRCCRARGVRDARLLAAADVPQSAGPFDTIVMLGQNFGMVGSRAGARRFLRLFDRITTERGRLIVETYDPHSDRSRAQRAYISRNRCRGRMPGQMRWRVRYRELATPWFDWLQVSERELVELLDGSGWTLTKRIGDGPSYVAVIDRDPS
jgi:SAM-dependent methyltransferase